MTIDITKPLDTELARTLPGYIRETRAALEGAVTDSSAALAAVGILEDDVDNLAALIAAALVKFPNQGVFVNGDATPSVSGGIIYRTANTTSTAITYLDGGFAGQMVIIVADDENTTVVHNPGYIILEGGVSITFNANQGIILVCHENSIGNKQWIQVGSIGGGSSAGNAKFNRDTFTVGAGGQSSFDTSVAFQTGQRLMFPYVNGELQPSSKFTEVDSNTITFGETLPEGTFVELVYITTLSVSASVDDLFVVNKPYIDARQYNSFVEANTAASLQNKLLVISTSLPVEANGTFASDILLLPGGAIEIAAGFNTVFSGTVTLEANSEIDSATGSLEFSGGVVCKGGTINATGAISITGPFTCSLSQCFTGSGAVTFGAGSVTEVYPEWWGAVGDGVADDTIPIQRSITSVPVYGKIISSKIYSISADAVDTGSKRFIFSGGKAGNYLGTCGLKLASGGSYGLKLGELRTTVSGAVSSVQFENICIDGNSQTFTSGLVVIQGLTNAEFDKCAFISANGPALSMRLVWQTNFNNCLIARNASSTGVVVFEDRYNNDNSLNNNVVKFTTCQIEGNTGNIFYSSSTTANIDALAVLNCEFEAPSSSGSNGVFVLNNVVRLQISGNQFANFTSDNGYTDILKLGASGGFCSASMCNNAFIASSGRTFNSTNIVNLGPLAQVQVKTNSSYCTDSTVSSMTIASTSTKVSDIEMPMLVDNPTSKYYTYRWLDYLSGMYAVTGLLRNFGYTGTVVHDSTSYSVDYTVLKSGAAGTQVAFFSLPHYKWKNYNDAVAVTLRAKSDLGTGTLNLQVNGTKITAQTVTNTADWACYTFVCAAAQMQVLYNVSASDRWRVEYTTTGSEFIYLDGVWISPLPPVKTGTAAPAVLPAYVGQIYCDTSAGKVYIATGVAASSDFKLLN